MQLVVQVKLAPYSESKLDVVRGSGKVGPKASVGCPHRLLNPVQVETVLTIGLVVLSLCGMVHYRPYPCPARPMDITSIFVLRRETLQRPNCSATTSVQSARSPSAGVFIGQGRSRSCRGWSCIQRRGGGRVVDHHPWRCPIAFRDNERGTLRSTV